MRRADSLLDALVEIGDYVTACGEDAPRLVDALYSVARGDKRIAIVKCRGVTVRIERRNGKIYIYP